MRFIKKLLICVLASAAVTGCAVDPRIILLPAMAIDTLRGHSCTRNLMYTYVSGRECPEMTKSPVSRWNANGSDPAGYCWLSTSVFYGNLPAFEDLMEHGADPKSCKGYPDVFYEIILNTPRFCYERSALFVPALDRLGIDPPPVNKGDTGSVDGVNYFGRAVMYGCVDVVKKYLSLGVSAAEPVSVYSYPIQWVHLEEDSGLIILELLIKNGANPDAPSWRSNDVTGTYYENAKKRFGTTPRWPKIEAILRNDAK